MGALIWISAGAMLCSPSLGLCATFESRIPAQEAAPLGNAALSMESPAPPAMMPVLCPALSALSAENIPAADPAQVKDEVPEQAASFLEQAAAPISSAKQSGLGGPNQDVEKALNEFWDREGGQVLTDGKGLSQPLAFGFDSEISLSEAYGLILNSPKKLREFKKNFKELRDWRGPLTLSKPRKAAAWAETFGLSEKQLQAFAIRKGVKRAKASFLPTDLNPTFFHKWVNDNGAYSLVNAFLVEPVRGILKKREKFPVKAWQDTLNVEIQHESFERSPRIFDRLIGRLHRVFKKPQTHLHLGIPSEVVSREKAFSIARALETKIILKWALDEPKPAAGPYADYSYLTASSYVGGKGAIQLNYDRWGQPVISHDIEVREWDNIGHGMALLSFAARMALEHARIKVLANFKPADIRDRFTINLNGALRYAGEMLVDSGDPTRVEAGRGLLSLSRQIEEARSIDGLMRVKIHAYLKSQRILGMLDENIFLKKP